VVQHPGRDCTQDYSTGQLRRGRPSGRLPWLPPAIVANETPVKQGQVPRRIHTLNATNRHRLTRRCGQIADSARDLVCQPKHTGEDRSSIPALGWCRMIGGLWVA